ncbi:hypothetical protein WA026_009181 [Henosepilachna vigintioctopunctata]|uniref:Uncharacterized protein n=1 Tax=Henosepilachna vigintioctopunctata TaxID=420089 RepID=A0AAW1UY91_9CUCU
MTGTKNADKMRNWKVLEDETMSLHNYISYEIIGDEKDVTVDVTVESRWNTKSFKEAEKAVHIIRNPFPSHTVASKPEASSSSWIPFTEEDVKNTTEKLKNGKVPGPDLIPAEVVTDIDKEIWKNWKNWETIQEL